MTERISRGPEEKGKFATQEVDADIYITDRETGFGYNFALTGLETENTKFNRVDTATATIVPRDIDFEVPRYEDDVQIEINGVTVFTGYVGEVTPNQDVTYEVKCFNDVRRLKSTSINIGTEENFVLASDMLTNQILPKVGITDYEIHLSSFPILSILRRAIKSGAASDTNVQFEETETPAVEIIDTLAQKTNSVWWIDGEGTFHFGNPQTEIWELSYVKDASAGKTTPPYRSVKVIGGGGASQNSWSASRLIPFSRITAVRTIENVRIAEEREQVEQEEGEEFDPELDLTPEQQDAYRVKQGELKEPVYTFRDKSIHTQKQADAIANALIDELVQQTRQGWVEIVGWAGMEPYDVIEMPDFMGGERYLVQGVEHTLDTSQGFTTRVQCGGLVYEGNESSEEGAYE